MNQTYPLAAAVLGFLLCLAESCHHAPAAAQCADVVLLLARVGVNEAGFHGHADHRAITAITIRQARRRGLELDTWTVQRFKRALAPAERRRDRFYIAHLRHDDTKPEAWNEDANRWSDYSAAWLQTLEEVADVIAHGGRGECRATDWGSPVYDREEIDRKLANGWEVVDCGATRNTYLRQVTR